MAKLKKPADGYERKEKSEKTGSKRQAPNVESRDELREKLTEKGLKPHLRKSKAADAKAKEPEVLDTYKVASGDTLSHIALKYYGSAARDKWMAIYEANKDVIGDNPSLIRPGQELEIPQLGD